MKTKKCLMGLFFVMLVGQVCAQKSTLWLSYSQSPFVYSPGVEYAHFFGKRNIGIQAAINPAFIDIEPERVSNAGTLANFQLFHNFNLGICAKLLSEGKQTLGASLGAKVYYGSDYRVLDYYETGGYNIYYDFYESQPAIGYDFGLFYNYDRLSALFKYDTACGRIRLGIGYNFGEL